MELNCQVYMPFYGKVTEVMPTLLSGRDAEGELVDVPRHPAAWYDIMVARLSAVTVEVQADWCYNDFGTGDAAAQRKDGRLKIVLDALDLRKIGGVSKLVRSQPPL